MKEFKNIQKEIRQNFLNSGEDKFLFRILSLLELNLQRLNTLKNCEKCNLEWFSDIKKNYLKIEEVLKNKFLIDKIKISENANLKELNKIFEEVKYFSNGKFNDKFFQFDSFDKHQILEALHFIYKFNYNEFVRKRKLANSIKRIERCFDWLRNNSLESRLSNIQLASLFTFETGFYILPEDVVKISNFEYRIKNHDFKFQVFMIDDIPIIIKDKKKLFKKSDFKQLTKNDKK